MKGKMGTESCEKAHNLVVLSGKLAIKMLDGTERFDEELPSIIMHSYHYLTPDRLPSSFLFFLC